ncbi:Hypothetical predicted protein [Mytilus galloprovincialis]|uniref:Mab-21-like HhH/H2TH-like domain-containing protein n=1 Tax=Mytilus galloprovincialis TaxID=29158 RepID=A0A8B6FDR7_MYTGA|nr:Hypothetical predicted protein [Mytilus galloprovincialis]
MAETDTTTVSLALYRYLCQNIVGTENSVKTIRLMNTVRDNVTNTKFLGTITSGSFGEGIELRGSDLDIMEVNTLYEIYADEKPRFKENVTYYRMKTDDVKPGFTQLILEQNVTKFALERCELFNGKQYLSSSLCKQQLSGYSGINIIHGPCLTDKKGVLDVAFCLHCKTWISQASQWISRSNNSWPNHDVKQSIINHGVLFVPIGVKGSLKEDIEWRISFSVGEKMLISTFTHTQLLCYALMKILLKDVITTDTECSDLLCSYFLKTIIFWISEELPQSVWKPENLIPCFMRCFSRLIYCVKYSACLHYFIPENNMFENKIEGRARKLLLDKLYTLHSYGWRCVLFSDQLYNFHVSMWMNPIESTTLRTIEFAKTLNSKRIYMLRGMFAVDINMIDKENNLYNRVISKIVSCDQSSLKYLYTYYMSLWCTKYAQSIPLTSPRSSNKHQYKQYNSCLCALLQSIHHDAVSGWLMLASFFYQSKQYSNVLSVLVFSLSKFTSEKLYRFMNMSDIHCRLLTLKSFQKKSIVRLWKIMLVDFITFEKKSLLIPNELQMDNENGQYIVSSIVYAYFLQILCHYHLNNVRQCQDCINTLHLVIAENYFIEKEACVKSRAYNILGIVLQLTGDYEAARQAFMHSLEIYTNHRYNTSRKRLLLMSSL